MGGLASKECASTVPTHSVTAFLTACEGSRGTEDQCKDCRVGQPNFRRSLHPIRTGLWRRHHVSDLPNITDTAPTFVVMLNDETTTYTSKSSTQRSPESSMARTRTRPAARFRASSETVGRNSLASASSIRRWTDQGTKSRNGNGSVGATAPFHVSDLDPECRPLSAVGSLSRSCILFLTARGGMGELHLLAFASATRNAKISTV